VTCRDHFSAYHDLDGYDSMDRNCLEHLKNRYALDYAVIRRGHESALGYKVVFSNSGFVVLDLRGAPSASLAPLTGSVVDPLLDDGRRTATRLVVDATDVLADHAEKERVQAER
jgi:hypothetical protein